MILCLLESYSALLLLMDLLIGLLTLHFAGSGLVLSCGSNSFGQLGVPQISGPCLIPQKIEVKI